ncbi:MAG TPA: sigma-70 family RNA polymerase sigma factor [Flavipsychrobacter sp.]|nr:sigma-70 family RNA polymerase sigma factor [Flavipsychrobacter sp.]
MPHQPHKSYSDEELLARFQQSRDNVWLGHLLQRYTILLFGVAMKYLKDKDAAEDAVQQVFYKVLTHLPEGEIQNFKGWLYVLMRNHCLQQLRERNFKAPEETLEQIAAAGDAKEELLWKDYTLDQMNEALKELNEEQRQTVVMFYLQKKTYQQIVEQTGYSYMQVKSFIQNGKRNLKMILLKKIGNRQP